MDKGTVLVTGATGYVGSRLTRVLLARGWDVRTFDTQFFGNVLGEGDNLSHVTGDIRDRAAVDSAMAGCKHVIHLAAIVTDGLVDMNVAKAAEINLDGTRNVAKAAAQAGIERLLYASSSSIYGTAASGPVPPTEDTPPEPQTDYGHQKLMGEGIVKGVDVPKVICVRSASCCGPAPRMRLDTVVNIFSKQAFFDGVITVHGGDQYRSNLHVADAAAFYAWCLEKEDTPNRGTYNVSAEDMKVGDIGRLVETYAKRAGKPCVLEIQDVPDPRSYRLDTMKARRELGWRPTRSIGDAIRDNFRFFAAGNVEEPDSDYYYNTRRLAEYMKGA